MEKFLADLAQVCGCYWAVVGETEQEVVSKTAAHAKSFHGMSEVPDEITQKLHSDMRPTM